MTDFLQQVVNGLATGSIYALIAVGYSMVYGVLELINFAHGDIFMVATFVTISLMMVGVPWPIAILLGIVTGGLLAMAIERFAYRPLRGADRIVPTITAVGAALILQNVALLTWGPQTRPFPLPFGSGLIDVGGVLITTLQLVIMGLAAVCAIVLFALVQLTPWGRAMRAIRDDATTAELVGIPVNKIVPAVYAVGGALGVVGGILFAAYYNAVYIGMGFAGTMYAFVAAVLGGIGSLKGAFIGGLLLGVMQALAVGYIASGFENTVAFIIMIGILILKPRGLFALPTASRV
ncbi:branched-chain amino acid ABC transporter permease [Marinivivus vitaminiproducens]|uniref:branched-chain amino acid ABC transporter permease n=1 Tax=Marinivivus vitaminiproducens TaxID=3035935 RepID=UPI0027A8CBAA|nr:branched-chain amino acid ABC transporter permease [Geminicoccaceae bacterium SCSIO 64248]